MISRRHVLQAFTAALFGWLVFVAVMYGRSRQQMHEIAEQLAMPEYTLYTIGEALAPLGHVPGDERLPVAVKGHGKYLLASIVRNTAFGDWRGQWKIDLCMGGDPKIGNGWLSVSEWHGNFPSNEDIATFRRLTSEKRFAVWDTPEGSSPKDGG